MRVTFLFFIITIKLYLNLNQVQLVKTLILLLFLNVALLPQFFYEQEPLLKPKGFKKNT